MPGIAAHLQAALEGLDGVERAYVDAVEGGFDIRIITAEEGRLTALHLDGVGDFAPMDLPAADEGAKLSHYHFAFDGDGAADADSIYSLAFDDDRTDDLAADITAADLDTAIEGMDGIGEGKAEVSGGDGDFLISVNATEGLYLQHDGIGDFQQLDYLIV